MKRFIPIVFCLVLALFFLEATVEAAPVYDLEAAFLSFNKNYKTEYRELRKKMERLKEKMFQLQKEGKDVTCSRQISEETSAALNNRAEFSFVRRRLNDLEASLSDPKDQNFARHQSPKDGSWGQCYEQWSWKVVESVIQVKELAKQGKHPRYPVSIFDRINSPESLSQYITSVLISTPEKDGINRRRELNEVVTTLIRVIQKGVPRNYPWHPKLWESFQDYMDKKWQNPDTGFWGAWVKRGNELIKTDDLSITFHIVSYRDGKVLLWEKLANTVLAIKDRPYPLGWRHHDGSMSNHHNYDVVRLLRLGFGYLTKLQKDQAAHEIQMMVDWCLSQSLQPDGSFKYNPSDDSLGDSYYFGTSLLSEAGFFDRKKRFWTEAEFPRAGEVRERIIASLKKIKNRDAMMEDALDKLEGRD